MRTFLGPVGVVVAVLVSGGLLAEGEDGLSGSGPQDAAEFNLARLAQLEAERGNGGGADDAAVATPTVLAGWDKDKGFFIADSSKEDFLLRIGGRIQLRYTGKFRDVRGSKDPTVDPNEGLDRSYFSIPRGRLVFQGHVLDPALIYYVQLDGSTANGGGVRLLDAYAAYKLGWAMFGEENKEALTVGMGQWKPYFLRQEATSSGKLQMVERSLANEFFNTDRQLGIWMQGELGSIFYALAMTNGFDSANVPSARIDQIPAFLAKLDWSIFGNTGSKYEESNVRCKEDLLWTVGASAGFDKNNATTETDTQKFTTVTFGLDTILKWWVVSVQAEYMGRWLEYPANNTVPGMNGDGSWNYAQGYYIQGGVFLWPEVIEVTGRVSQVIGCDGGRSGDAVEAGPGLNWYISKSHKVKLQTDLMFFDISPNIPVQTESLDVLYTDPADPTFDPFESTAAGYETGLAGEQGVMWRVQLQLEF